MKKLILILVVTILQGAYWPFKQLKARDKLTLISRQSDEVPADFILIKEFIAKKRPEIEVKCLSKTLKAGTLRAIFYPFHMLRQMYHIATARVILLDGYCIVASAVKHKRENIIVQMWHATAAIKKFGWQIVGKPGGSSVATATIMRMHANYDHILAPSKVTGDIYLQAFHAEASTIKYYGLPHLASLKKCDQNISNEIRQAYQIDPSKKTILYVPTFRNGKYVDVQGLVSEIDFNRYNFVVRIHPIDKLPQMDYRVVDADRYATQQWMQLSDIIITDYSSLLLEAAIMMKELYIYTYDIEEYTSDTGLNMDFDKEPIRSMVFHDSVDLVRQLDKDYDYTALHALASKYIEIDVENSLSDLGEFIEALLDGGFRDDKKDNKGLD